MPEQENTEEKQLPPEQRKKQLLTALGGIGLLIALIAAGVFLFNQDSNEDSDQTPYETTQEENAENLQLSEAATEIPDDFPDYIDIYEPSELLTSSTFGLEDSNNWIITFETESSIDAVYAFYKDYFSDNSWEVLAISVDDENYRTISVQNEDLGSEVAVSASTSDIGFTSFSISVAEKQL